MKVLTILMTFLSLLAKGSPLAEGARVEEGLWKSVSSVLRFNNRLCHCCTHHSDDYQEFEPAPGQPNCIYNDYTDTGPCDDTDTVPCICHCVYPASLKLDRGETIDVIRHLKRNGVELSPQDLVSCSDISMLFDIYELTEEERTKIMQSYRSWRAMVWAGSYNYLCMIGLHRPLLNYSS